jgi:DNA-binding response OmpR family regulator
MPRTVLVVEDSPSIRRTVEYVLTEAGFATTVAPDGATALERMRREHPRVVLLDIDLPGIDGFEVCRRVREDATLRSTFIVMLTSKGQPSDAERAMRAGADRYVTKPFDEDTVLPLLREVLGTRPT